MIDKRIENVRVGLCSSIFQIVPFYKDGAEIIAQHWSSQFLQLPTFKNISLP